MVIVKVTEEFCESVHVTIQEINDRYVFDNADSEAETDEQRYFLIENDGGEYIGDAMRDAANCASFILPDRAAELVTAIGSYYDNDYGPCVHLESNDDSSLFLYAVAAGLTARLE